MNNSKKKRLFYHLHFIGNNKTIIADRLMAVIIRLVSLFTILAILTIFVFITWEVVPLFQKAKIKPIERIALLENTNAHDNAILFIGSDEWGELPFTCNNQGIFNFYHTKTEKGKQTDDNIKIITIKPEYQRANLSIEKAVYRQDSKQFVFITTQGDALLGKVDYQLNFTAENKRIITPIVTIEHSMVLFKNKKPNQKLKQIAYARSENTTAIATITTTDVDKVTDVNVFLLSETINLFGESSGLSLNRTLNFSDKIEGNSEKVLLSKNGNQLVVFTDKIIAHYFNLEQGKLVQKFTPFDAQTTSRITTAQFVFGDVSIVFVNEKGQHVAYSRQTSNSAPSTNTTNRNDSNNQPRQTYTHTKTFPSFSTGNINFYANNVRNKAFAIGYDNFLSLRYLTTEKILLEQKMPFNIKQLVFNDKYNRIFFLEEANYLSVYDLKDPHPEADWKTFFSPIQYESSTKKTYTWQSSAVNQDYEPKLSMIPLMWGSLKGTFFALIFALPLALTSALYTSQFLNKKIKNIIKPVIEIMSAIPSVVLGFLGALYLAPFLDRQVPSLLLVIFFVPISAFLSGKLWSNIPTHFKNKWLIKINKGKGVEFILYIPIMIAVTILCWQAGPLVERLLFQVKDVETGRQIVDFRLWWSQFTGSNYEQRNSIIVGIAMGFAVIPIIFSIAEEAFSNVPKKIQAGGLALGCTEWQLAINIVLPAAIGGVFSAVMIGFGRAIGETMIVLMATGNTPIIDFNAFTGMRTLAANIAVELPEAPQSSTLYRALFLGAFILFVFTFITNTIAEIIRQKFKKQL